MLAAEANAGKEGQVESSTAQQRSELPKTDPLPVVRDSETNEDLCDVERILFRLTAGLPKRELRLMVQEASECENHLLEDIRILENALKANDNSSGSIAEDGKGTGASTVSVERESGSEVTALSIILASPLTPLDRYWTASALLGRLRQSMALPSLLTSKTSSGNGNIGKATATSQSAEEDEKLCLDLSNPSHPLAKIYSREVIPVVTLLAVWKKISSNRAASVFKRPVRSEDAPGYTERILFPMELSLIRKRIVANDIQTYADLHGALGLISHNCVKYNGRETDYGRVARDFEAMADAAILQAVRQSAAIPSTAPEPTEPATVGIPTSPAGALPISTSTQRQESNIDHMEESPQSAAK